MSNIFRKFPSHESIDPLSESKQKQFADKFEIISDAKFEKYITSHHKKPPSYHYGPLLPLPDDMPLLDGKVVREMEKHDKAMVDRKFFGKKSVKPGTAEDMPKKSEKNGPKLLKYFISCGKLFKKEFRTPQFYDESYGSWYPLTTEDGRHKFMASLTDEEQMNLDSACIENLADAILSSRAIESSRFETPPSNLLNFKDAVFNIETEEILPHDSSYMFTYCINATTDMIASDYHDGSMLSSYLEASFKGNQEKIDTLGEIFGVAISSIRDQKQMFYLYGPASCGKSVALNILNGLICDEFVMSLSFKQLSGRFELSELCGSCLNLSSEIPNIKGKVAEVIKRITGNDVMHGERKTTTGIKMLVRTLLVFATNTLPHVADNDEAFYSRFRVLRYEHTIPKSEWIKDIDRIILKEETGYVLRFAIDGLKRYIANGMEISGKDESDSCVYNSRLDENSFSDFASRFITVSENDIVMNADLFAAYDDYCHRNHLAPASDRICSQILTTYYNATPHRSGKNRDRGYMGIHLGYFADDP